MHRSSVVKAKRWRNEHGKAGFPWQLFWDLIAMLVSYKLFFFSLSLSPPISLFVTVNKRSSVNS